jgi:hypothetical protein
MAFLIGGANSAADTGFDVDNSCRFNDGDSAKMSITLGTPTNDKKWTWSGWVKRCTSGTQQILFEGVDDGANYDIIELGSSDQLKFKSVASSSESANQTTNMLFRDPSAWYHIVVAQDSTQAAGGNRLKIYVNGTQVTSLATDTQMSSDHVNHMNVANEHNLGASKGAGGGSLAAYFDGYMAEVYFIDGTQYAASDFGEFDEDSPTIWKPKDASALTFGNNGFYLDFKDSANLGNDANGGTDLDETNFAAADQSTDTCTNNFCTWNTANPTFTGTNSEGNLKHLSTSSAWRAVYGTLGFTTGKWYAEFKMVADGSSAGPGVINTDMATGVDTFRLNETNRGVGQGENAVAYLSNAQILDGGNTIKTGQTTWTDGDILGVAIDATNGFVYWHKAGTYLDGAKSGTTTGDPTSGGSGTGGYPLADLVSANGTYLFGVGGDDAWHVEANFGGCPAFSISSGNADANGYGNFEYSVPSGYLALCTKNLGSDGG